MSEPSGIGTSVNRGLAWVGFASAAVAILDAVAKIVIFRVWVPPAEYGVGIVAISLFPVLDLATDLGLFAAVIQKDDHTVDKISTLFWINLGMSLVLFGAVFFVAAPVLVWLHGERIVGAMLIVYGTKMIFQNSYFIPYALMRRELRFRELSIIRIIANVAEFAGKLGFAAAGFGVWCFVFGPLLRVLCTAIGVQLRRPWRPRLVLRLREVSSYLRFGLMTSASQMLFQAYSNADYQVVAVFFGKTAAGLYAQAYELILESVRIISVTSVEVAFPVFARIRSQSEALERELIKLTRQNLVVVLPFVLLILLAAPELLIVLFGPAWAPAATAARVLCIVGALRGMSSLMPPLLDGIGKPTSTLKYMTVASVVLPTFFFLFAKVLGGHLGFLSVAIAWAVGYPIAFAVLARMTFSHLGRSPTAYLRGVGGLCAWAAIALVIGAAVRTALPSWPPLWRLVMVGTATLAVLGLLLARFEGITPRSVRDAVRGKAA